MEREIKYSRIVVLTGAGASKPCGLPDMMEFSAKFADKIAATESEHHADLLQSILDRDGQGSNMDLEALMTGLTALTGQSADPASDWLLGRAQSSSDAALSAIGELRRCLRQWIDLVPLTPAPYRVSSTAASPLTIGFGQTSPQQRTSLANLSLPPAFGSTSNEISAEMIESQRTILADAASVLSTWNGYFPSIPEAANTLLDRLKKEIRNTYSSYDPDLAASLYSSLLKSLLEWYGFVDLFTLNYDTVLENALQAMHVPFSTGYRPNMMWWNTFPRDPATGSAPTLQTTRFRQLV